MLVNAVYVSIENSVGDCGTLRVYVWGIMYV